MEGLIFEILQYYLYVSAHVINNKKLFVQNNYYFAQKVFLELFVKPFHSFKIKSVLYSYSQQNRFPMFVLRPGCFLCIECLILKFHSK